ncbi:MAG: DUF3108 domain-containing protein [Nitrospirota bacterium]
MRSFAAVITVLLGSSILAGSGIASDDAHAPALKPRRPFHPGEKLVYTVSWSKVFSAGTAVMEVKQEQIENGREAYRFISTARTTGMVKKVYSVHDVVQSLVDRRTFQSISYDLNSKHGSKRKERKIIFNHEAGTALYFSGGDEHVVEIAENAQDALSSLYYVRCQPELIVGKSFVVDILDSGKNWAVEVHVMARERIKTPVGEFDTIKVRTYPKFEGVFMNKGEIFIWLTDDSRRVPVLMKSMITIGSIVATLTDMNLGDESQ